MLRVAQVRIGAQRAKEGLLERILRAVAPEPPHEKCVDLVPVLLVEALEGRQRHLDML